MGTRAHKLVSLAGSLGFLQLSRACSELEQAANAGSKKRAAAFRQMRDAAEAVLPKITELRTAA